MRACFLILPLIRLNTRVVTRGVCREGRSGEPEGAHGRYHLQGVVCERGAPLRESNKAETDIATGREGAREGGSEGEREMCVSACGV
jgi:hypothetical protein